MEKKYDDSKILLPFTASSQCFNDLKDVYNLLERMNEKIDVLEAHNTYLEEKIDYLISRL